MKNSMPPPADKILGSGLLAQLEHPQAGRKFPADYHEAYWFYGYDADRQVGFYLYLVADKASETLRHEQVYLYLPDGSVLGAHSSGHNTTHGAARGETLEFRCEVPFVHWRLSYAGRATEIPAALVKRGVKEKPVVAMEVSLDFEALTPAWNTEGDWGEPPPSLRYHQLGRASGTVTWADRSIQIGAYCFRSHSRRQRELAGWVGHTLSNGRFEDGRAFGIFCVEGFAGRAGRHRGFIIQDDQLFEADVTGYPRLGAASGTPEQFVIGLVGAFGQVEIAGTTVAEAYLSQTAAGRQYGICQEAIPGMVLADGFARYRWGDAECVGVLERSASPAALQAER